MVYIHMQTPITLNLLVAQLKAIYMDPDCVMIYNQQQYNPIVNKIKISLGANLATPSLFDPDREFVMVTMYADVITLVHCYEYSDKISNQDVILNYRDMKDMETLINCIVKYIQSRFKTQIF